MRYSIAITIIAALLAGCSSREKVTVRKAELIRDINAIQASMDEKQDLTSLFSAGPPQLPKNLAKLEESELEEVLTILQGLDVSLTKTHSSILPAADNTTEGSPNKGSEASVAGAPQPQP
jgi:hypothetical protein